jgi:aminoglycoside phosphotransferase (APT) family kinase protein
LSPVTPLDDFDGLLDWGKLQAWIDARSGIPGSGPVTEVERIAGGSQNNLFMMTRGGERFVLRRPPLHLRKNSNSTMLREARLLGALKDSTVPHARLYDVCADESVIGACFYVMEPLDGFSPSGPLPGRYATEAAWRRAMGEEFMKAAAGMSAIDYAAVGLADYGKVENWHERQVDRWRSQLEGYRETPGYAPDDLPDIDRVGRWLMDNIPADRRIGVIHGDFQYPNVMYRHDRPVIAGLIDWELSTLGDPMLDLGWVLQSWVEPGDLPGRNTVVTPWDGFLTREDLIRLYCELTGRDIAAVPWFFTLACYKLGCILEGTYARSIAGEAPRERGEYFHALTKWLFTRAAQLAGV